MAPLVAETLARLALRGHHGGDNDLVFVGDEGGYADGSALRRRCVFPPPQDQAVTRQAGVRAGVVMGWPARGWVR